MNTEQKRANYRLHAALEILTAAGFVKFDKAIGSGYRAAVHSILQDGVRKSEAVINFGGFGVQDLGRAEHTAMGAGDLLEKADFAIRRYGTILVIDEKTTMNEEQVFIFGDATKPDCEHEDVVTLTPYRQIVQCVRCGQIFIQKESARNEG